MNKINTLTSLRFFMIITIFLYHFEFIGVGTRNFYDLHFHNAGMGVDYFFILSGFGLTYSSIRRCEEASNDVYSIVEAYKFAQNKIKKIWKWYIVSLIIMIIPSFILSDIDPIFNRVMVKMTQFVVSLTLLQSGTGISKFSHAINPVCWFLSCIFIIYMIYPRIRKINDCIILKREVNIVFLLIVDYIVYYMFHLLFSIFESTQGIWDDISYGSPYIRIFQFIAGVLLCDFIHGNKNLLPHNRKITSIIEMIVLSVFILWLFYRNAIFYGEHESEKCLMDFLIASIIVLVFSYEQGFISDYLNKGLFVCLGNVSMYIFLFHFPVIRIMEIVLKLLKISIPNLIFVFISAIVTMIISLLANYYDLSHKKCEIISREANTYQ